MRAHIATLAGGHSNADRAFLTSHAAILLDGATAHEPLDVDPATYADTLGAAIADHLDHDPAADLPTVVATGITRTAAKLHLTAGHSPSSTVAILRARDDRADLYVLGDSPIHYGTDHHTASLTDDRLAHVAPTEHTTYRDRLRAGHGYDQQHSAALVDLQRAQRAARNTAAGYWIAEADPAAGHHAITRTLPTDQIGWAVLATDGAADLIDHTGRPWVDVANADAGQLADLLAELHHWETASDPDGRILPRAKRHDDKTLIAIPHLR